jgi:hypothetical protein
MRDVRKFGAVVTALVALSVLAAGSAFAAAAPQAAELWGGPGAKGAGLFGATFDTTIYIGASVDADVTVDFFQGGSLAATLAGSVAGEGVIALSTPDALAGKGAFFYRIRATAPVTAWSETDNSTPSGLFGLSVDAFLAADFLGAGDEATGAGAEATTSTEPGRSRTNVGIFCAPGAIEPCRAQVLAYRNGALLGTGILNAAQGSAVQSGLSDLIHGADGHILISLRFRLLNGTAAPYAIKNHNDTSDAARIPLTVTRSAFSTAPSVETFTVSPSSGCAPLQVTLTWTTFNAARVTISGVSGDLPPNGSTTATLLATSDLVLTAYSFTGDTASVPRHVSVLPPTQAPTPTPSSGTVTFGQQIEGLLPQVNGITAQFVQQQSTGSTFVITNSLFIYTAGSVAGTDIVRLTLDGPCGPVTADFTATVQAPGTPKIDSFTADPMIGCAPANVVVTWVTENVRKVNITGLDFALTASGSYGFVLTQNTLFTLTAFGLNGTALTAELKVEVDAALEVPILSQNNLNLAPGQTATITITGVTNPANLRVVRISDTSGGIFNLSTHTNDATIVYQAGGPGDAQYNVIYRNGCGVGITPLIIHVQ